MKENNGRGGEGGIRTHGRVTPTHAFQACSLNRSDTSPLTKPNQTSTNFRPEDNWWCFRVSRSKFPMSKPDGFRKSLLVVSRPGNGCFHVRGATRPGSPK